jgi:ribosome maturation factor RimP
VDTQTLERIREIAVRILEFAGMELVHLEMKREPGGLLVRLFIDKSGGVSLDDCARISRQLSGQLDLEDPIPGHYTLEVSSPGLDRPLYDDRDYVRFAGKQVRLSTFTPIEGRRHFVGRLVGLFDGAVRLVLEGDREIAIPRDQVAKARLEVEI